MTWLLEASISCPWCGEVFPTTIDTSQGDYTAIEDCNVCCRPIDVTVVCVPGEIASIEAGRA